MAKVLIVNFDTSPRGVKVEVQGRDKEGKFVAASEHHLKPGEAKTVDVDDHQSVQLIQE